MVEGAEIHRIQLADGIGLSVTTAGDPEGQPVMLLHGFPELAYSWRHQIAAFADAGLWVIAPDQRGYGWSDAPEDTESYDIFSLTGDVVGLLDHFDIGRVTLVGHDWGSIVAWHTALFRPDRLAGLALLSLPYQPRGDLDWPSRIALTDDSPFAYMAAFADPDSGMAEVFNADPIGTLRTIFLAASGPQLDAAEPDAVEPDAVDPTTKGGHELGNEAGLPRHLTPGEFENYCRASARAKFDGPLSWYRNMGRNWELTRAWHGAPIEVRSIFIGGAEDFVTLNADAHLGGDTRELSARMTDLVGDHRIEGAGHWLAQEAPDEVTAILLDFIAGKPASDQPDAGDP